jgi:hypothetical protein
MLEDIAVAVRNTTAELFHPARHYNAVHAEDSPCVFTLVCVSVRAYIDIVCHKAMQYNSRTHRAHSAISKLLVLVCSACTAVSFSCSNDSVQC